MGRPRKQNREPFWRSKRDCWYVHHGSTTIRLSADKDEDEAWRVAGREDVRLGDV